MKRIRFSYSFKSFDTVLNLPIIVFPKIPESKPTTEREIDIKKIQKINPKKRIVNFKKLYSFKTMILNIKIINKGINQDASPKITNNKELTFAPKEPKAFKGGSSFTVNIEGSKSLCVYSDIDKKIANNKQKQQIKVLYITILKLTFFNFESILIVLLSCLGLLLISYCYELKKF